MSKIYFYGGAFNPFTIAHQQIIDNLINELKGDDILHIGITSHDYKTYEFDKNFRLEIVKSYMNSKYLGKFNWEVSFQDERTWNYLHKIYVKEVQNNIVLIMGQDEYDDLKTGKWHRSDDILDTYNIKVIPRTDDVSSSKVRELIRNKQFNEVKKYVGDKTFDILKAEGYVE